MSDRAIPDRDKLQWEVGRLIERIESLEQRMNAVGHGLSHHTRSLLEALTDGKGSMSAHCDGEADTQQRIIEYAFATLIEQCAQIADERITQWVGSSDQQLAAQGIAAKIRKLKEQ